MFENTLGTKCEHEENNKNPKSPPLPPNAVSIMYGHFKKGGHFTFEMLTLLISIFFNMVPIKCPLGIMVKKEKRYINIYYFFTVVWGRCYWVSR
jgi:hypothetical protein